jgi:hypothetical protein
MSETNPGRLVAMDEAARPDDPAERLGQLWRQGKRPDVGAFVVQAGPLTPTRLAAVLRVDQRRRWQRGERVRAED